MTEDWKKSAITTKFPSYRNEKLITSPSWLKGKRHDDEAEGLWRIYDTLYDLTDFIDKHPGGRFWLEETKGTDITEQFESHHLTSAPAKVMENYKVREAKRPRIYKLTLHDNGFYKTLKRRVIEKMKTIDKKPKVKSDLIHTALLMSTFSFAIASLQLQSWLLLIVAGLALCWTTICAHNYFHRRDNWRMYTFNLSMMNVSSWRVSHAMSHHIYPNTFLDLELSLYEPLLCWVPNPHIKSLSMRYVAMLTSPFIYIFGTLAQMMTRLVYSFKYVNIMYWHDLLCLSIPLALYTFADASLFACIRQWLLLEIICSVIFSVIGLHAAHHDPEIYHEGDAQREDYDWGLFQVDTIIDRSDIKGSQFFVLTHFGDHMLHHLFPTLDHGVLPQLYPILFETLDEFKGRMREFSFVHHLIGQHKQLLRVKPNPIPPGMK